MICPSCQKSQPMSYRCRSCGADLLRRGAGAGAGARSARVSMPPVVEPGAGPASDNPYASPEAARVSVSLTATEHGLASRSSRLAAAMLDGLVPLAMLLPVFGSLFMVEAGASADASPALALGVLLSVVLLIAFAVYQISLLIRRGQTLGKKLVKIRIVNYDDGRLPPWAKVFGVRYLVNGLIGQLVPVYVILDAVFIFGAEQRCIHDYLAGTKVVGA